MRKLLTLATASLAAAFVSAASVGTAQAAGQLTLCWAAWDPANALVQLSKDFTAKTGTPMKFEVVPWTSFADRFLNELNSKGRLCDLLIGDSLNNRVRVVAARTGTFYGKPMAAGDIYTIAGTGTGGFSGDGGPATSAELSDPTGVAVDGAGNLLIADFDNCRIRVVAASTGTFYGQAMTAGHIYTVAGNGIRGLSGDGGPATSAEMNDPGGAAMDPAGNLVIADSFNGRIRVVAASSGTFYGQAMTAGNIYTVAGGGVRGLGDGGPATSAMLSEPGAVALDPQANLVISDDLDNRIRIVTH